MLTKTQQRKLAQVAKKIYLSQPINEIEQGTDVIVVFTADKKDGKQKILRVLHVNNKIWDNFQHKDHPQAIYYYVNGASGQIKQSILAPIDHEEEVNDTFKPDAVDGTENE